MIRPTARAFALVCAVMLSVLVHAGCGGPDGLNVDGTWSGTWQFVASGLTVTDQLTANLNQNDTTATGTWQADSGASGQLQFNTMGTTSGMLTINQATIGGGSCNATTSFQGTVTDTHIDITFADIPPSGICQWGTSSRFVLDKQ